MYCVLYDESTKGPYMERGDMSFHAYSDPDRCLYRPDGIKLVETEYDTLSELLTVMWKDGFIRGEVDDSPVVISPDSILCFGRNGNDVVYCQYLLTGKKEYLDGLNAKNLYTLCKIEGDDAIFPAVKEGRHYAILAYTSPRRMTRELLGKYRGYRIIRISFTAPFIINDDVSMAGDLLPEMEEAI